ncbi:MAG: hypothetical protein ABSA66_01585 [Roseiarcus sp.]
MRLPANLSLWIAEEASNTCRSMNGVVVEALNLLKDIRADERRGPKHDAAVSKAMTLVEMPQGTSIIIRSGQGPFQTELLRQSLDGNKLALFALVIDEDIQIFNI